MKGMTVFECYTEHARRAIFFARYEAGFQSADTITTGHLLVGLMHDRNSRAVAIVSLKENEERLRSALGIPLPDKTVLPNNKKEIRLHDYSKMALAYAAEETSLDNEYWIDTDSLLRGLLRFSNEASAALETLHIDLETVRTASRKLRAEKPLKKTLYHRVFGSPFHRHRYSLAVQLIFALAVFLLALLLLWINR